MFTLLLVAACSSGKVEVSDTPVEHADSDTPAVEDSTTDSAADSQTPADSGADTDTGELDTGEAEEPETWPKACSDLYDQDALPTFALSFEREDWAALNADCAAGAQTYHPVQFTYEGETVSAMARLKGNWSWSCDKMQFVISFNEEDSEARFHGQRKLMLDAPWYDRTLLHERVAFPLFERLGLPYSCVNNAVLTVNGSFYGVYANLERIDHEYLERHFEEEDGNLYQGGTELKTNEDEADTSNLDALRAATTVDEVAEYMDLDQAVAEWAAEAMLPAMDNYWAGVEINYYLYDHPTRGFLYLPYDLDISFGDAAYPGSSEVWPDAVWSDPITYEHYGWRKEDLVKMVLADRAWCDRFVEELRLARAAYDPVEMAADVDAWQAQIADAVAEDARMPYTVAEHDAAIEDLKAFFVQRAEVVDDWLADGDHCPARW